MKSERRSRLKPFEKNLDIGGIKSYLAYLNVLFKKHDVKVNCNIIQREIILQTEKLAILEKSMLYIGIYLADIGKWLNMEGFAKAEEMDFYIYELKKYSAILTEHAISRKNNRPD